MPIRLIVSLLVVLVSLPALGQEPIPQSFLEELARDLAEVQQPVEARGSSLSVRVVKNNSTVYAGASTETQPIMRMGLGDEAPVIDNTGEWYAIQLPNDKSGWVQARDVAPKVLKMGDVLGGAGVSYEELEAADPGWFESRILSLLERAATFRDVYQDNPYVIVRGFDISLSLTGPTLGMSFEFKE